MKKKFKLVGSFDTETCTPDPACPIYAWVCLLQLRIWSKLNGQGKTKFYSTPEELVDALPMSSEVTPIIAVYNLSFDFVSLIPVFEERGYSLEAFGPESSPFYIDVMEGKNVVLRFWEVSTLVPQGLEVMGELAGVPKLKGSWDYSKYREPYDVLTPEEKAYAIRDTEVIQAYLQHLLKVNPFLKESDLGTRLLTQTGLVRLYGERVIGRKEVRRFVSSAAREEPKNEKTYRLRKACFRAGLAFTAGRNAGKIFENVTSIDTVSMHHSFILGRKVPIEFHEASPTVLKLAMQSVLATSLEKVLENYDWPFRAAFHASIRFKNLRLKDGSVFENQGIATLARSKFAERVAYEWEDGKSSESAENRNRLLGYHDKVKEGTFAFGKLVKAEEAEIFLTETETWLIGQVYDWDSFEVLEGEIAVRFQEPPTFILKLDEALYKNKRAMKIVLHGGDSNLVPTAIKKAPRSVQEAYYKLSSKAQFNSVFGLCAMDAHKFETDFKPTRSPKSWYTLGMRIAGGSRLHLALALMLLDQKYRGKFEVLGGDTDSIKLAGLSDAEIQAALKPLHEAITKAIKKTLTTAGIDYEQFNGIGTFESEGTSEYEIEIFNKNRLAWNGDHFELTAAGIPTPADKINLEKALTALAKKWGPVIVMNMIYGPNLEVDKSLSCFMLPVKPQERRHGKFAAATALVPRSKMIGDLYSVEMQSVRENLPRSYAPREISLENGAVMVRGAYTQEVKYWAPLA